jgi:hypothetical protein
MVTENLILSNYVIDSSGNVTLTDCMEILKSGPNKGNYCGCKILKDNMCKRHFDLKQKISV